MPVRFGEKYGNFVARDSLLVNSSNQQRATSDDMLKNGIWLFILAFLILAVFLPSYRELEQKRQKIRQYESQIEELKFKNARLAEERRLLDEDPVYLEKVAREKMKLLRQGEEVVHVESPQE